MQYTETEQKLREALESYEHMIANGHKEHDALHAFDSVDIPNLVRAALAQPAEGGEVVKPAWWMRETDEGVEWTDTAPIVLSGWTQLYTTPQPAQAAQAAVTDAEIVAVMRDGNNCNYNDEAEHIQFARAILAMRPVQVPMTDEVEKCAVVAWAHFMDTCRKKRISPADWGDWCSANAIRKSHHGITAQDKKETP